jgi:hypothetical protein
MHVLPQGASLRYDSKPLLRASLNYMAQLPCSAGRESTQNGEAITAYTYTRDGLARCVLRCVSVAVGRPGAPYSSVVTTGYPAI